MIMGCNIEALRKLRNNFPTWKNADAISSALDTKTTNEDIQDDNKPITLMEVEHCTFISPEDRKAYWKIK
jgi:hypothetical protein